MRNIKSLKWLVCVSLVVMMVSCDRFEGDVYTPAYLKIDAINVVDNPSDPWSLNENGFFTSLIDGVNVVVWQKGDTAEINLGMFQLPCKIPVLKNGVIDRVLIYPVVKQNGIAGSRIYYPYYEPITVNNVVLTPDSLTDLGSLQTRYKDKSLMSVVWQEWFEPGPGDIVLDTVVQRLSYVTDTVRSGYGCGVIRVSEDKKAISFWSDTTIHVPDPNAVLYLEMDYWTDFDFNIGFKNPRVAGGEDITEGAMTLYANSDKGWQKIYINLGRLWSKYNYYPYIRLYFTIFNSDGRKGNVYIDNMKVVSM